MNTYKGSYCNTLVPNENIIENNEIFMDLVNVSSLNLQRNLTKDVINKGAKMFIFLNSCSKTSTKENFLYFFKQVFDKASAQYSTNSGMILYTLREAFNKKAQKVTKLYQKLSNSFMKLDNLWGNFWGKIFFPLGDLKDV